MIIALGSTQKDKIAAARAAIALVPWFADTTLVSPVAGISSGVMPQPVDDEIRLGAYNRAVGALTATMGADVGLGIENGLGSGSYYGYDFATIVIVGKHVVDKHPVIISRVNSIAIRMPNEDVRASFDSRRQKTAGAFLAERTGCDPADPHAYLTGGLMPRAKILEQAILAALAIAFPKPLE